MIDRIWRAFKIKHVDIAVKNDIPSIELIPGEDLVIYLAALNGDIDVLISENREFIRQAAVAQKLFECLSMQEFLEKYGS